MEKKAPQPSFRPPSPPWNSTTAHLPPFTHNRSTTSSLEVNLHIDDIPSSPTRFQLQDQPLTYSPTASPSLEWSPSGAFPDPPDPCSSVSPLRRTTRIQERLPACIPITPTPSTQPTMASAWLESQERRIRADDETVKSRPSRTTSKASPDASPLAAQHRVTSTSHDVTSQPSKTTQPNVNIKPPKSTIHESLIPTRVSTATASNRTHHSPSHDSHPPPSRSSTAKSAFRASKAFSDTSSIDLTSMSDRPSLGQGRHGFSLPDLSCADVHAASSFPQPEVQQPLPLHHQPDRPVSPQRQTSPQPQTSPQSPSSPHSIHPPPSNFGSMSVNPSQWSFLSRLKRPTTIRTPSPRSSRSSTSSKWPHSRRTSYSSTEEFRVGTTSPSESLVRQRRGSGVSSLAAFAALQASQHVDRPRRASWAHGSGGFPIGSAEFGRAGRSVVAPGNVVALAVADSVLPGKPRRLGEVEAQSVEVKEKILPLVKAAAVTLPWRSRLASGGRGIEEKLDSTSRSKSRVSFAVNGEGTVKTGVVSLQDEGAVRTMKGDFQWGNEVMRKVKEMWGAGWMIVKRIVTGRRMISMLAFLFVLGLKIRKWGIVWRVFMFLCHVYLLITVPLHLGWTHIFPPTDTILWFHVFLDFLMMVEPAIAARRRPNMEEMNLDSVKGGGAHAKRRVKDAYDRENGETKMEAWARRFWESGGAIKVMASIPIQMMAFVVPVSGEFFQVFGIGIPPSVQFARYKLWAGISMAKLFLRFPLYKIIITKMPGLPLPVSRLLKANFFYLTLAHVDACLFFALDLTVDSPLRWVDVHHLIKDKKGTHYVSFVTQYLECLRESLCTIQMRVREVSAELNMETAWSIGELALGILVAGTVAGVVESLVERLDSNSELMERKKEFQYQTERIREYFKTRLVSPDLQKMFLMARTFQWQKKKNMDEADIFDGLPTDLLRQAKNFLYLDLLKKVPLFNGLDDSFYSILTLRIKNLVVPEGFFIFRKGDIGAEMYIIRKGDVEILNAEGGLITVLSDGSSFGEVALYQGGRRTASARTKTCVEICILARDVFKWMMTSYPEFAQRIEQTVGKLNRVVPSKVEPNLNEVAVVGEKKGS